MKFIQIQNKMLNLKKIIAFDATVGIRFRNSITGKEKVVTNYFFVVHFSDINGVDVESGFYFWYQPNNKEEAYADHKKVLGALNELSS